MCVGVCAHVEVLAYVGEYVYVDVHVYVYVCVCLYAYAYLIYVCVSGQSCECVYM